MKTLRKYNIISPNCVGGFAYLHMGSEFLNPYIWHVVAECDYRKFFEHALDDGFGDASISEMASEFTKNLAGEKDSFREPFVQMVEKSQNIVFRFIHHRYEDSPGTRRNGIEVFGRGVQELVDGAYRRRLERFRASRGDLVDVMVVVHGISGWSLCDDTLSWYAGLKTPCLKLAVVHSNEFSRASGIFAGSDVVVLTSNSPYMHDAGNAVARYLKAREMADGSPDVVVSLTTYKDRILNRNLSKVLDSIIDQNTSARMKLAVTVFSPDCRHFNEEQLNYFDNHGVEVIMADENLRPHLKYYYCAKKHRDVPIITVDDDAVYHDSDVEALYKSYLENPECVSALGCRRFKIARDGRLDKISTYGIEYKPCISNNLLGYGVCGVLYPPDVFDIDSVDVGEIRKCLTNDDVYFKCLELRKGVKVKNLGMPHAHSPIFADALNDKALYTHENTTRTDLDIQKFLDPLKSMIFSE